jgi:hypothetical protein
MPFLGRMTWDYFSTHEEAYKWHLELKRKGNESKYIGERNGRFVVQAVESTPQSFMNNNENRGYR